MVVFIAVMTSDVLCSYAALKTAPRVSEVQDDLPLAEGIECVLSGVMLYGGSENVLVY